MEFKIYQDRQKINNTGNVESDYRILFPQTIAEAVIFKNEFAGGDTLDSVLDYLIGNGSYVIASEDKPTISTGDVHWMKIIGTYNNGVIGNIFLNYVLNHHLRNHDGTTVLNETENIICKNGETVTPQTKEFDGYLPETPSKVTINERGQIVDIYYDEQQYNILYVLSGGTNHSSNPSKMYYTEEFTLKDATKTYTTFSGWYLDSDFANKITKLSKISKDITLYAKWIETEYGITYILDGGTNASSNPNVITYYQTVDLADATKANNTFNGWYTDSSFTNKVTTLSNINSDITLYAKFTESSYTITYVLNGGTNSSSNPSTITSSQTVTLANATKSGYAFDGWYTEAGFTNKVTVLSGITSNITLYAKFVENAYTITYVLNGGTNNSSNPSSITSSQTVTLLDATKSNSTFNGWYTDSSFSNKVTVLSNVTSNITLYAKFTTTSSGGNSGDSGTTTTKKTYLYSYGDECTDITGGWTSMRYFNNSSGLTTDNGGDMQQKNSDHLYLYFPPLTGTYYDSASAMAFRTNKKINLSNYTKVGIKWTYQGTMISTAYFCSDEDLSMWQHSGGMDLPISGISTEISDYLKDASGYVSIKLIGAEGLGVKIYEIWVEEEVEVDDSGSGDSTGSDDGRAYLYNRGDECRSLTGGWSNISSGGTVTINSDHLYMYMPMLDGSNTPLPSKCYTINSFSYSDLSKYTKLCIKYSFSGNTGSHKVAGFTDSELGVNTIGTELISSLSTNTDLTVEMESYVDISDISSLFDTNKHLGTVLTPNAYSASTFKIHQIWLE